MVVLSRQYAEKYMLFLQFSAGGLHGWGILLVIPFEFQEIKHQPFSMTQPKKNMPASSVNDSRRPSAFMAALGPVEYKEQEVVRDDAPMKAVCRIAEGMGLEREQPRVIAAGNVKGGVIENG